MLSWRFRFYICLGFKWVKNRKTRRRDVEMEQKTFVLLTLLSAYLLSIFVPLQTFFSPLHVKWKVLRFYFSQDVTQDFFRAISFNQSKFIQLLLLFLFRCFDKFQFASFCVWFFFVSTQWEMKKIGRYKHSKKISIFHFDIFALSWEVNFLMFQKLSMSFQFLKNLIKFWSFQS